MDVDFLTGKPKSDQTNSVAVEYTILAFAVAASCVPWALIFWWNTSVGFATVPFVAFLKVAFTFFSSTRTDTAHHIRFLLAGSNPIAMTGGSSLLLGAVDSILDWREDSLARKKNAILYWLLTATKFMLTPIGLILMLAEYLWDLLLLRRGLRLIRWKWNEFFSLARYHNVICPEKSNDIFYADLAFARYRDDPHHYQWARMRSMVFELQHYKRDIQEGIGSSKTNLFRQDPISAYQILKRLELERIEQSIAHFYAENPESFIVPPNLTGRLVKAARPIGIYLRFLGELSCTSESDINQQLSELATELAVVVGEGSPVAPFGVWHLLRLIDVGENLQPTHSSDYLPVEWLRRLANHGFLGNSYADGRWRLSNVTERSISDFLIEHFEPSDEEQARKIMQSQQPAVLRFRGKWFVPSSKC